MTEEHERIARAWFDKHCREFDEVEFQVHLGTQLDIGPSFDADTRERAALSSQKRADIVVSNKDVVTIVEVKERITIGALGQALGYAVLWHAEHPDTRRVESVVIGSYIALDVAELLQAHGVQVELFP